jgi:cytochrome c biogenesis protein ResB
LAQLAVLLTQSRILVILVVGLVVCTLPKVPHAKKLSSTDS